MARVTKRREARIDLKNIWAYIAKDSPNNADRFLDRLGEAMLLLAENPEMGRLREELAPSLRGFPVGDYLIFFRPLSGSRGIEVVRVLHGARDIERLFEE